MDKNVSLAEMTVDELLKRWPETAVVFNEHHMACVGCVVAEFYTIAEAADVYGISAEAFVAELASAIKSDN